MIPVVYTKQESGQTISVHPNTLHMLVVKGRIQSTKVGRKRMFTEAHLNKFIKDGEV